MKDWLQGVIPAAGLLLLAVGTATAATDAERCEAAKLKLAGKYGLCRLKAEAKAVKSGNPVDYSPCDTKFANKWPVAETNGGGACPTNGDAASVQNQVTADADFVALKLTGVRFVDNGDGTITDTETALMWEKKDNLDGVVNFANAHDADNTYAWADAMSEWISFLNGYGGSGVQVGFAGYTDWRLPTATELESILLAPYPCATNPCIDPVFGPVGTYYWSSTTSIFYTGRAFFVLFTDGYLDTVSKSVPPTANFALRAVRDL